MRKSRGSVKEPHGSVAVLRDIDMSVWEQWVRHWSFRLAVAIVSGSVVGLVLQPVEYKAIYKRCVELEMENRVLRRYIILMK